MTRQYIEDGRPHILQDKEVSHFAGSIDATGLQALETFCDRLKKSGHGRSYAVPAGSLPSSWSRPSSSSMWGGRISDHLADALARARQLYDFKKARM